MVSVKTIAPERPELISDEEKIVIDTIKTPIIRISDDDEKLIDKYVREHAPARKSVPIKKRDNHK